MAATFFVGDTGTATVDWVDAAGNEDTVAIGADSWDTDNPAVATCVTGADGLTGEITCLGVGTCNIRVKGTNKADGTVVEAPQAPFRVFSADAAAGSISIVKNASAATGTADASGDLPGRYQNIDAPGVFYTAHQNSDGTVTITAADGTTSTVSAADWKASFEGV